MAATPPPTGESCGALANLMDQKVPPPPFPEMQHEFTSAVLRWHGEILHGT